VLDQIESTIRNVAGTAAGAVVSIGRNGRGSGFVLAPGRVVTSAHNLRDRTASVTFADGRTAQGEIHGADVDGDLVVLDVDTGAAAPLELAEATPGLGGTVIAIARGGHRTRATIGFVSAVDQPFRGPRGRIVEGSVEHTAPLARGSSGGPLLDTAGCVVGINTHRVGDGFYLARAVDDALRTRVGELLEGRSTTRRTIGVAIAPARVAAQLRRAVGLPERDGLLVRGVEDGSPAARAGVQQGDLLVRAGDRPLTTVDDLQSALDALAPSGAAEAPTLELGIVRGADELAVTVSFAEPA